MCFIGSCNLMTVINIVISPACSVVGKIFFPNFMSCYHHCEVFHNYDKTVKSLLDLLGG